MYILHLAGRILTLLTAVAFAWFIILAWQDWRANSMLTELSHAIEKGMTEQAVTKMASSKGAKIRHNSDNNLVVSKVGGGMICRFHVAMNNGVVMASERPLCID